jgi:hypothetical protein
MARTTPMMQPPSANMRFVPIKSEEAQGMLAIHRAHRGFIEERTATINRIRGLTSLTCFLSACIPKASLLRTLVGFLFRERELLA